MNNFWSKLRLIARDPSLLKRLGFVVFALAIFRLGAALPIPGVNVAALQNFFAGNQFFGLLNIFSGGGLANLSIFMLGVGPYITASIILQLLTIIFPYLKEVWHEEGEMGRRKFAQYSRLLTVPLAAIQGFGFLVLLECQGVIVHLTGLDRIVNVVTVIAGSVFLMWLGGLIGAYGIGNGVSLIIFAGILAGIPSSIGQVAANFEPAQIPLYLAFLAAAL